jgi:hypothetical protein
MFTMNSCSHVLFPLIGSTKIPEVVACRWASSSTELAALLPPSLTTSTSRTNQDEQWALDIAYLLCLHVSITPTIMDQGLGEESHAESSSTPHPQPHELEEVADVNEHERLLPQTSKTHSSMSLLSFTNY